MTHTSHIEKLRNRYAYNRLFILSEIELNLMQYNTLIFDCGIRFLEEIYPRNPEHEKYYKIVAYDKAFWDWWLAEWKRWEDELIEYINLNKIELTPEVYRDEMTQITMDGNIEYTFHENYQKPKFGTYVEVA